MTRGQTRAAGVRFAIPAYRVGTLDEALRLPVFTDRERAVDEAGEAVRLICDDVRVRGDAALLELTRRFDGVEPADLRVDEAAIERAAPSLAPELRDALELAAARIRRFHEATAPARRIDVQDGLPMWREFHPVAAAGLYVPGGTAAYPSSVLMLAIPARVAGVPRVALATPPGPAGEPPAAVLFAARLAGVSEVYACGGAQAVAALAYGTDSIPRVDVIAGPGNRYVTAAKRVVYGRVQIDGLAGPSEIALVADGSTPETWAALDLIAQLEHDRDARALVVGTDARWLERVAGELSRLAASSSRSAILETSIAASAAIFVDAAATAAAIARAYAPEHLSVLTADAGSLAQRCQPAGAVFLGPDAPVAVGDYLAGPNHTLPTGGTARSFSAVGVETFGRWVSVVDGDAAGLKPLLEPAAVLADAEGLPGHAASLRARGEAPREPSPSRAENGRGAGSRVRGDLASPPTAGSPADGLPTAPARPQAREVHPGPRLSLRARAFRPYRAARHDALAGILLDANESPDGGFADEVDLGRTLSGLGRYPDPSNRSLRETAARAYGVPVEAVFAGNGSDEAIDLVFRAFTDPGDEVLVAEPTYSMYRVQASLHGVALGDLPLDSSFRLDPAEIARRSTGRARVLFLCSPNNPTGNLLGRERILEAVRRFSGLVVLDEAYVEFAGVESLTPEAARTGSSLLVLRTLSKAWGLAALRVGFAIGDPAVAEALQRVKLPYNLSAVASALAVRALSDPSRPLATVERVLAERIRLDREMRGMGLEPLPSDANFLLVPHPDASRLVGRLAAEHGVVIRDRSGLRGIPSAFRVTVGTPGENARFLEALAACLA